MKTKLQRLAFNLVLLFLAQTGYGSCDIVIAEADRVLIGDRVALVQSDKVTDMYFVGHLVDGASESLVIVLAHKDSGRLHFLQRDSVIFKDKKGNLIGEENISMIVVEKWSENNFCLTQAVVSCISATRHRGDLKKPPPVDIETQNLLQRVQETYYGEHSSNAQRDKALSSLLDEVGVPHEVIQATSAHQDNALIKHLEAGMPAVIGFQSGYYAKRVLDIMDHRTNQNKSIEFQAPAPGKSLQAPHSVAALGLFRLRDGRTKIIVQDSAIHNQVFLWDLADLRPERRGGEVQDSGSAPPIGEPAVINRYVLIHTQ